MKNIYYLIWVDGIVNSKDYKKKDPTWKFTLFLILTICNAINMYTIYLWIKFTGMFSYLISVAFFSNPIVNSVTGFVLQFASPFVVLNYFLIFHKERYKSLIEKYQHRNGKLAMIYLVISVLIWFGSIITYSSLC
ncbi:hypothetical protein [Labilibaculum manganireducens]|nr:hypothetical protein [Labilibaculum manganireducens]